MVFVFHSRLRCGCCINKYHNPNQYPNSSFSGGISWSWQNVYHKNTSWQSIYYKNTLTFPPSSATLKLNSHHFILSVCCSFHTDFSSSCCDLGTLHSNQDYQEEKGERKFGAKTERKTTTTSYAKVWPI